MQHERVRQGAGRCEWAYPPPAAPPAARWHAPGSASLAAAGGRSNGNTAHSGKSGSRTENMEWRVCQPDSLAAWLMAAWLPASPGAWLICAAHTAQPTATQLHLLDPRPTQTDGARACCPLLHRTHCTADSNLCGGYLSNMVLHMGCRANTSKQASKPPLLCMPHCIASSPASPRSLESKLQPHGIPGLHIPTAEHPASCAVSKHRLTRFTQKVHNEGFACAFTA